MATKEPEASNPEARLENWLKGWRKDHIQGDTQVVIKPRRRSGPVPLNEFGNTRLTFQHAVNELEQTLLGYLRSSLEQAALEVGRLGMPAQDACSEYESRSDRKAKEYINRYGQELAELRFTTKELWDEYEHPFSEEEIQAFRSKFESSASELRTRTVSDFKTAAWSGAPIPRRATVVGDKDSRSARREEFVQPILYRKGWTPFRWATDAGVDKNTIRDYLNGVTKKPRPSNLRAMAEALGVDVSAMPR
jgi:hypothetical protein